MPEPTPITKHRRYTKRQKAAAVTSAMASSAMAAAEAMGIPRTTIVYWLDSPEFVELRQKTREDLAQEMSTLAHLFATKLSEKVDQLEPRDLVIALGIVTDKAQLLAGHATERLEHRELDEFDDHETRSIVDAARKHLAGDTAGEDTTVAEEAAVEGAGA